MGSIPHYYNYHKNNPLSQDSFNLIDAISEDWKQIKHCLDIFKVYAQEYIKNKYEVDLKLLSKENDSIICETCGSENKLLANYCNSCGIKL